MAQPQLIPQLALLEEAVTILFCLVEDIYYRLNPKGRRYEKPSEKRHERANRLTIKRVIATYINASPVPGTLS